MMRPAHRAPEFQPIENHDFNLLIVLVLVAHRNPLASETARVLGQE
jgi:hypothetical protein